MKLFPKTKMSLRDRVIIKLMVVMGVITLFGDKLDTAPNMAIAAVGSLVYLVSPF